MNVLMQNLSVPGVSLQPALQGRVEVVPVVGVDKEEKGREEHSKGEQDREEACGKDETSGGRSPLLEVDFWRYVLPHLVVDRPNLVVGVLPHPGQLGQGGWRLVLTVTSFAHLCVRRTLTISTTTAGHHTFLSLACF